MGRAAINTRLGGTPGSAHPSFALLTLHHAMYSAVLTKAEVLFTHASATFVEANLAGLAYAC